MEQMNFDKESILKRIVQIASRILHTEFPQNLDPLVQLLLEAIASEVYLLSDSAVNIENRLLEKLASTLIPTAKIKALPAHAVICADPIETECVLGEDLSFYYEDYLVSKKYGITNIPFTPVIPISLKKANIRYLICNGKCFLSDKRGSREFVGDFSSVDLNGMIWIGLDVDLSILTPEGFWFYWDFPATEKRNEYIDLPASSIWSINGHQLKVGRGIVQSSTERKCTVLELLSENDVLNTVNHEIYSFYEPQFVTITDDYPFVRACYPEELSDRFAAPTSSLHKKLNTPLLWVKVSFPPMIPNRVLEQCNVHINAFPVLQKGLDKREVKLDELKNIIPLKMRSNEHFLSVNSVQDSHGRNYQELSAKKNFDQLSGSYSIRYGGCERFDSRDAKEYLNRLTYLLTEELAAFASSSKENVSEITNQMLVLLERMKNSQEGIKDRGDITNYLIVDSPSLQETISVSCWVTNGEVGNNLPAGKVLLPPDDTAVDSHSIYLITSTSGGRKPLSVQEKVICFRNVITTRGRLFTKDDIVSFCMSAYPGIITSVEVKHGVMQGVAMRKGLVRSIDVCLSLSDNGEKNINKVELCQVLERKLKACSPETFNYRILLYK